MQKSYGSKIAWLYMLKYLHQIHFFNDECSRNVTGKLQSDRNLKHAHTKGPALQEAINSLARAPLGSAVLRIVKIYEPLLKCSYKTFLPIRLQSSRNLTYCPSLQPHSVKMAHVVLSWFLQPSLIRVKLLFKLFFFFFFKNRKTATQNIRSYTTSHTVYVFLVQMKVTTYTQVSSLVGIT